MSSNNESLQEFLRKLKAIKSEKKLEEPKEEVTSLNNLFKMTATKEATPGTVPVHLIQLLQLSILQTFAAMTAEIEKCTDDGPKFQSLCNSANRISRLLIMINGLCSLAVNMQRRLSEKLKVPFNQLEGRAVINKETFDSMWDCVCEMVDDNQVGSSEDREFIWNSLSLGANVDQIKMDSVVEAVNKAQATGATSEEVKNIIENKVDNVLKDVSLQEPQKRTIREIINKLLNKDNDEE